MKTFLSLFCLGILGIIQAQESRSIEHTIASKYFDSPRTISIHLPKKYTQDESLPVIFVLDAQWKAYFDLTTSLVDYLIETREFPRSIVVGIHHEKRQFELTPKIVNDNWDMPHLGGAGFLEKHISQEIIPLLHRKYHIENFSIGIGHSLGGTFVLNSTIDAPNLFNASIVISPNLQIDEEEITKKMQRHIKTLKSTNTFIYTTIGTSGHVDQLFKPYLETLDTVMQKHESDMFHWSYTISKGFNHATTPLEGIHKGLLALAKKWKLSEVEKQQISNSNQVVNAFNAHYKNVSQWMGYWVIPSKDAYYNMAGYLETNKKYKAAISIYKEAIKNYPQTSKLYYSIAQNFEQLQHIKEAEHYYLLASKIIENEAFDYQGDKEYYVSLYHKSLERITTHLLVKTLSLAASIFS